MTMVQVPEEHQCQLKVNIMSNRKNVMLTKDVHLSSHPADFLSIGQLFLDLASLKSLLAWGCERQIFN